MAIVYIDTSALARVLLGEPDAQVILRELDSFDHHIASRLLRVELRRVALREGRLAETDQLLAGVALFPLDQTILSAAESLPPSTVRTLDAIHLATALQAARTTGLDALLTYDARLAAGAREHDLTTLAPG